MTYRLERFLKKILSEKVYEATDGLYDLTFDDLTVGLYNGELLITGLNLEPNQNNYVKLLQAGHLSNTTLKIKIHSIYFQGINLTWRWSYKKLDFKLFAIQNADIQIYESQSPSNKSDRFSQHDKSLYEMISPYINVLQVNQISLKDMTVTYKANDGNNSSIYGLQNVDFNAYNFRIDQESYLSGNLLYSENFDFTTYKPQQILSNNQFLLKTNKIVLNTSDSLVQIDGISLLPDKALLSNTQMMPNTYAQAQVSKIALRGIKFKRDQAQNYLTARLFEIGTSDLEYFTTRTSQSKTNKTDTLNLSWSLYSVISPILNKVSIKDILLKNAKFKYSEKFGADTNLYTLSNLEVEANNFIVDSLSKKKSTSRFLHSENVKINATGINGINPENNYLFAINQLNLNTATRAFSVQKVTFGPIRTNTIHDYISGNIDLISIDSLNYVDKGVQLKALTIESPQINYTRSRLKTQRDDKASQKNSNNVWEQLIPLVDNLWVQHINIKNANVNYNDRLSGDYFSLHKFDFFANNIKIDEHILDSLNYIVASDDFGFTAQNFVSQFSNKYYKLSIDNTAFDKKSGHLTVKNFRLTPQTYLFSNADQTALFLDFPSLKLTGLKYQKVNSKKIAATNLYLDSPKIRLIKFSQQHDRPIITPNSKNSYFENISLGQLNITNAKVNYLDSTTLDSLHACFDKLKLSSLRWQVDKKVNLEEIILDKPHIEQIKHSTNPNSNTSKQAKGFDLVEQVAITKLAISDLQAKIDQPDLVLTTATNKFAITNLDYNTDKLNLEKLEIIQPKLTLKKTQLTDNSTDHSSEPKDVYQVLNAISKTWLVKEISILGADLDYQYVRSDVTSTKQTLNKTDLVLNTLHIDNPNKHFSFDDIKFNTQDLSFPIDQGMYTLQFDRVALNKQKTEVTGLKMIPAYPKSTFAINSPGHKDWFKVSVDKVALHDIDLPRYFANNQLIIRELFVKDVVLDNFKNHKIESQHNVMPMIYEKLQLLPIKLLIKDSHIQNFAVNYEELPKKGDQSAKLYLNQINGHINKLTNIVSDPNEFIDIRAAGKFMGTGDFTAKWSIPVARNNDCFYLEGNLHTFDLTTLNQLITPLAPAGVRSGQIINTSFNIEASSMNASAKLLMLYNDLQISVLKKNSEDENKFLTRVANVVLRDNNPNKPHQQPRIANTCVERDAYHSTFNYFWQILQPAVIESVGVSQRQQNLAKKISSVINKIKHSLKAKKAKNMSSDKKPLTTDSPANNQ